MTRVLIIQGEGMDRRGLELVEVFGPETLEEINTGIEALADQLAIEVDIFQSNDEAAVVERLSSAAAEPFAAMIINPGGFTPSTGPLPDAVGALPFPAYEVHASNPASRGVRSTIGPVCRGSVCGFGYAGYGMVLKALSA
ncbi:MAG: type II 3-dehydroquinate dehydratase [Pseudomonadota bacterium]